MIDACGKKKKIDKSKYSSCNDNVSLSLYRFFFYRHLNVHVSYFCKFLSFTFCGCHHVISIYSSVLVQWFTTSLFHFSMIVYTVVPFCFFLCVSFLLGVEFAECLVQCGVSYPTLSSD
jgi:hypothetical protein